ncbi:MAG: class I SAM-dependent RNA methyltransferase [Candidatus Binatia bacterium]
MKQTNAKSTFTLEIESLAYGPYGIGRADHRVIMIPATVPGDKISARVTEDKGNYAFGELVHVLEPSPLRQTPPCPYVEQCGGCPWQQVRYETQLQAKHQSVADALRRIGKLDGFELRPIIPSPREYHYRRRIRLQCDNGKRLGFFRPASHELVEIDACLIADDALNPIVESLRRWIGGLASDIEYMEIVRGDQPHQVVVAGKCRQDFFPQDVAACERLLDPTLGISGLVLAGRDWRRAWGKTTISILADDHVDLQVDADVFTQVNADGNRRILGELLAAGEFANDQRVLELYAGAGNFTLSTARRVRQVVAVEGHSQSIASGKRSAQMNGIENIRWVRAPVPVAVERFAKRRESFSRIVLDPPRAGAKGIDLGLASLGAEKILYVSCNPATLARDVAALARHGYKLATVQPVDLFPHTFHVESLAVMSR